MAGVSFWVWVLIWLPPIGGTLFTAWYWHIHTPRILKKVRKEEKDA